MRSILLAGLPLVIFLGLAGLFLKQLAEGGSSSEIPSALIGREAPRFELAPLEGLRSGGEPVPALTSEILKGKVSIVNVWASWCVPCRAEHPVLMELARSDAYQVVGINYKDKTENAIRFLGQLGNPFSHVGIDPRGSAAIDWGVYGVPETFIVGVDGVIRHKHVGPLTEQAMREKFLPALDEALRQASTAGS